MFDTDRYADIYLNFQDRQHWFAATFAGMTLKEYLDFVDYCLAELNFAAETQEGAEFRRVKGLILAIACKELEMSHFVDRLTDSQRASSREAAVSYYELARSFYPAEAVSGVEAAWAASLDHATQFGWPSVIFETQAPHRVFRDTDD